MIWDILDILLRLFDLLPEGKKIDEATEHFKK